MDVTKKLIAASEIVGDPTTGPLLRRIGHATTLWERAFHCAREEEWEIGWMHECDEHAVISDPEGLVLYSTVVLEALFSSPNDKQEVTNRIADCTAGLLGISPEDRFDLSERIRKAYGCRSDFVHGNVDRGGDYSQVATWLFKIASLALWKCAELTILNDQFQTWEKFIEFVQLRKYGKV